MGSASLLLMGSTNKVQSSGVPVTPESIAIALNNTAFFGQQTGVSTRTLTLTRVGGYSGTVSFSVTGLPVGTTASFSPATLSGGALTTTVTLSHASDATIVSADDFVITASGSGVANSVVNATVTVTEILSIGSWQLPAENFISAKMPMTVVYPRPDGETAATARHRKACPNIKNRIPISIQGGAYPFYYEIIAGPSGATIGSQIGTQDYGVWSWTPTANTTAQTVTVRVTDQDLSTIDVTWTMTADTASFVFLDSSVVSSGTGTVASPFKTFPDVFGTVSTDANNSGKILVFRGGSHTLTGFAGSSNNLPLVGTNKPLAWMAYPEETPVINCSTGIVNFISSTDGADFFAQGLSFTDSRPDVSNSRFFFFAGGAGQRMTFHEVAFNNLVRGTVGNDNPGAIVGFANVPRNYLSLLGCSITNHDAPLFGSIYDSNYVVVEGNTLGVSTDGQVNQGLYAKSNNTYWSFRRNTATATDYGEGGIQWSFTNDPIAQLVEVCYNILVVPAATDVALGLNWTSAIGGVGSNAWVYRNTIVGRTRNLVDVDSLWTVTYEKNVHITNDSPIIFGDNIGASVLIDNLTATFANIATLIDPVTYELTGSSRNAHLGRRGHEISAGIFATNEPAGSLYTFDRSFGAMTVEDSIQVSQTADFALRPPVISAESGPYLGTSYRRMYSAGMTAGEAGFVSVKPSTLIEATHVYTSCVFKFSPGFIQHGVSTKFLYPHRRNSASYAQDFTLQTAKPAAGVVGDGTFRWKMETQGPSANYYENQGGYSQTVPYVMNADTWYQVETEHVMNTPGVADGALRLWISSWNGSVWTTPILLMNYTAFEYCAVTSEGWWPLWTGDTTWRWNGYFGGSAGDPLPADQYVHFNRVRVSVLATR